MFLTEDTSHTCCFTGHRQIENEGAVFIRLSILVEKLYKEGYDHFICGGATGFDTLAALAVINLQKTKPVYLHLFLPCGDQTKYYNEDQKEKYEVIKDLADTVFVMHPTYTKGCMHERNREMVNWSSLCVAYCHKDTGGSAYTVKYAESKGLKLIKMKK